MAPSHAQRKTASFESSYPALPAMIWRARTAVASLAASAGADEEQLDRIRLAVSEAVCNAVLHAYPQAAGEVHVAAAVIDGELSVIVADDGCGLGGASESSGLGLGMALMAQMCDSLTFTGRASAGMQVEMRMWLAGVGPQAERARLPAKLEKTRAPGDS